jgi:hypothetical protein
MNIHPWPVPPFVLGFGFSIAANQIGVSFLTRKMRHYLEQNAKKRGERPPSHNPNPLTRLLGLTEALLYTSAILLGAKEFIAVWLALKAAVRWRAAPSDREGGTGTDNLWLIGSGASVFVAYLGASIARWQWTLVR